MSAGLPGLGLGGLFFILSALALPLFELVRTARGESSAASWLSVARQFGLAVAMIAAIDAVFRLLDAVTAGDAPGDGGLLAMPIGPVLVTIGILVLVLVGAKTLQLIASLQAARAARAGGAGRPIRATLLAPVRPTMRRAVTGLAAVWLLTALVATTDVAPLPAGEPPNGSALGSEPGTSSELATREPARPLPALAPRGDERRAGDGQRAGDGGERAGSNVQGLPPASGGDVRPEPAGQPRAPQAGVGDNAEDEPPASEGPPAGSPPNENGGGGPPSGGSPGRPPMTPSGRDIPGGPPTQPPGRASGGRPESGPGSPGYAPGGGRP